MSGLVDVTIKRHDGPIALEDWLSLVEGDPEFMAVDVLPGRNPRTGEEIVVSAPHSALWLAHPEKVSYCFRYDGGVVECAWVDLNGLLKARQVATNLHASVVESVD